MKNMIRELRARHGMSQEQLAEKVNATRQTIGRIEGGDTPSFDVALRISKVFSVSVNDIFFGHSVTRELQKIQKEPNKAM